VAKYSYGIYLTHGALLVFAFSLPFAVPVQIVVLALGMVIVPYVLFHMIEQPLIDIGRRVVARRRAADFASPATAQN
jgi:peptidoglycan/LPS O-acetylase OafA/YrhL